MNMFVYVLSCVYFPATYAWIMCTDYYFSQSKTLCKCFGVSQSSFMCASVYGCVRLYVCVCVECQATSLRRNPQQTRQATSQNDFIISVSAPDFFYLFGLALKMKISQFHESKKTTEKQTQADEYGRTIILALPRHTKMEYANKVERFRVDFSYEETMRR